MSFIDVSISLSQWLRKLNIDPDKVEVTIRFKEVTAAFAVHKHILFELGPYSSGPSPAIGDALSLTCCGLQWRTTVAPQQELPPWGGW